MTCPPPHHPSDASAAKSLERGEDSTFKQAELTNTGQVKKVRFCSANMTSTAWADSYLSVHTLPRSFGCDLFYD